MLLYRKAMVAALTPMAALLAVGELTVQSGLGCLVLGALVWATPNTVSPEDA